MSSLGEKRVCPQQVDARLLHPAEQTVTHGTFRHSLPPNPAAPDGTLACRRNQRGRLSHAIRAGNKDDDVSAHKREAGGSQGSNER